MTLIDIYPKVLLPVNKGRNERTKELMNMIQVMLSLEYRGNILATSRSLTWIFGHSNDGLQLTSSQQKCRVNNDL